MGDGWLPSFCSVEDVRDGWVTITEVAAAHDRRIDPEHLGVLLTYAHHEVPDLMRRFLQRRRPDVPAEQIVPVGLDSVRSMIESFIQVGASKFVVAPLDDIADADRELAALSDALFDLQT